MTPPRKRFNIGNFNLMNLVLPGVTFYGRQGYNKGDYQKKIEWIGNQLSVMNADLIGFQEVFHEAALRDALTASGAYENCHVAVANENGQLPRVALVSRFPILQQEVIEAFPEKLDIEGMEVPINNFSRPVLRAKVLLPGEIEATVFVVHLKSKRPMIEEGEHMSDPITRAKGQARSLIRRAAEASAIRHLIVESLHNNAHPVMLLGDVNDSGIAVTTRIISGEPPFRNMPLDEKKRIWDVLLYHAKDIQARNSFQDFYYSHIHNGHHDALDHIMVSQEFVGENPQSIARIGMVKVLNDHLVDDTQGGQRVRSWQSDHGQVVASVEMRVLSSEF